MSPERPERWCTETDSIDGRNGMTSSDDSLSFIMPAYNEVDIIEDELEKFIRFARELEPDFELIVVENGSTDETPDILNRLNESIEPLRVLHNEASNFGRAFKQGVDTATFEKIFLLHVDHWQPRFIRNALEALEEYPLVQGSKNLPESQDERPITRKLLTYLYNLALRFLFGFKGTDTTGLKAFRKDVIVPVLEDCVLEREMLETELVIRCEKRGLPIKELGVSLKEKRPQRDPLLEKIMFNVIDLIYLVGILYAEDLGKYCGLDGE